jgi:hypothetical protein
MANEFKVWIDKLNAKTCRLSSAVGHGIIHKDGDARWTAKVYCRGELHTDLGSFKTRRGAIEAADYHLAFEVK